MATHSSILAWKIPWTEELVGYSLWGCKESDTCYQLNNNNNNSELNNMVLRVLACFILFRDLL